MTFTNYFKPDMDLTDSTDLTTVRGHDFTRFLTSHPSTFLNSKLLARTKSRNGPRFPPQLLFRSELSIARMRVLCCAICGGRCDLRAADGRSTSKLTP